MSYDETFHKLIRWSDSAKSEMMSAHIISHEGYSGIDPAHPRGGPDNKHDAKCRLNGNNWIMACYFPDGSQAFSSTRKKFAADLKGVEANGAVGIAFVTNQEIVLSDRDELRRLASQNNVLLDLFHGQRVVHILDQPSMHKVRSQFLEIEPAQPEVKAEIRCIEDSDSLDHIIDEPLSKEQETCLLGYIVKRHPMQEGHNGLFGDYNQEAYKQEYMNWFATIADQVKRLPQCLHRMNRDTLTFEFSCDNLNKTHAKGAYLQVELSGGLEFTSGDDDCDPEDFDFDAPPSSDPLRFAVSNRSLKLIRRNRPLIRMLDPAPRPNTFHGRELNLERTRLSVACGDLRNGLGPALCQFSVGGKFGASLQDPCVTLVFTADNLPSSIEMCVPVKFNQDQAHGEGVAEQVCIEWIRQNS
jgi:hypothetical protein